jgi:hypothetical protein
MIYTLIPYILLSLSLIANLVGFLVLVHQMQSMNSRQQRSLEQKLEELSRKLSVTPARQAEPAFVPPPVRSGLNIEKRLQAVRMFRRNEDISHIAAAIGVARKEVELLIRVHKLTTAGGLGSMFQTPLPTPIYALPVQ